MGYPKERRESVLKKMLPPNNISITALAKEEGISDATLYNWRKQAREHGRLMPDSDNTPNGWISRDKFAVVMETAAMDQAQIAAYWVLSQKVPYQPRRAHRLASVPVSAESFHSSAANTEEESLAPLVREIGWSECNGR